MSGYHLTKFVFFGAVIFGWIAIFLLILQASLDEGRIWLNVNYFNEMEFEIIFVFTVLMFVILFAIYDIWRDLLYE